MQPTGVLLAASVVATLTAVSTHGGFNPSHERAAFASSTGVPGAACQFAKPAEPAALPNDNRTPAGTFDDGALEIRLVVRMAGWYPEGTTGCGLPTLAFAEEGKSASIPGPLIRVRTGTVVRATVRNDIATSLLLTGLHDHAHGTSDTAAIAPGQAREFRFRVTAPGTFFYRAITNPPPAPGSPDHTRQLVGAFIVDPPGPVPDDRVIVITRWRKFVPNPVARSNEEPGFPADQRILGSINGLSWPHSERLSATVGDTLRWRVINADLAAHPLHLHGFYFRVTAQGDMMRDTTYDAARRRMAVTEVMLPWRTMAIDWSPDRPGNWLFHCHMVAHMSPRQRLDRILGEGFGRAQATTVAGASPHEHAEHTGHSHEMAGLILGISVNPRDGERPSTAAAEPARRKVRLLLQRKEHVFRDAPGYGFVLQSGSQAPAIDSIRIPGPELALTRGEPVEITLINRATIPLSVHWHGIELESYFDGVAGWSGDTRRLAPPIAANDSFVVRFTPPRAGTFIYHVHDEGGTELASGLYGPLIVREHGDDPSRDRVFVVADAGPASGGATFINGTMAPDTLELVAGRTYRFRLISITANGGRSYTLAHAGGAAHPWRQVARDGWEGQPPVPGPVLLGPGMTVDFEVTPAAPGVLTFTAMLVNRSQSTSVPIRVVEPGSRRR